MLTDNVFEGEFNVNGQQIDTKIGAATQPSFMTIGALSRHLYLSLNVFTPRMLCKNFAHEMSEANHYSISGNDVGSLQTRAKGHPGDNERDRWRVTDYTIHFQYSPNCLRLEICGNTEKGSSSSTPENIFDLPPQNFHIWFYVPKENLKELLKLTDSAWSFFQEKLKSCETLEVS